MKTFFGSIFVEKEKLKEAGIKEPIKLEYYKIINEDEMVKGENSKYGIKIVKTQYIKEDTKVEEKTIKYLTSNEQKVNDILQILKDNEVTPISVQDIIYDMSKSTLLL